MANTTGKKFGGRTKGTPNKDTKALRDRVSLLLDEKWESFLEDIQTLDPKERVDTIIKLLEYALPKLNRTELRDVSNIESLMELTPEERRQQIFELKETLKNGAA